MTRIVRWSTARRMVCPLAVLLSLTVFAGSAAAADVIVTEDQAAFVTSVGIRTAPFPPDADTALPARPWAGLTGYSCTGAATGIDLGEVTVTTVQSSPWLCFIDGDWSAGGANVQPTPSSPTIIAEGEDDFLLRFDEPVHRVGLRSEERRVGKAWRAAGPDERPA